MIVSVRSDDFSNLRICLNWIFSEIVYLRSFSMIAICGKLESANSVREQNIIRWLTLLLVRTVTLSRLKNPNWKLFKFSAAGKKFPFERFYSKTTFESTATGSNKY